METCPQAEINLARCSCTWPTCPRKGNCCACLAYHLAQDELPACCFPPEVERTFDRSFRRFADLHRSGAPT